MVNSSVLGSETTEMKCLSHHIITRVSITSFIYFVQIALALEPRSSFRAPVSLWHSPIPLGILFLNASLLCSTTRYPRIILYISCTRPGMSEESCFVLLENCIRNQNLGTRGVHCFWDVISRPPQPPEQGNGCVCTNLCINTHL